MVSGVLARCLSAGATQQGKFEELCTTDQEAAQRRQTPEAREGHLEESCASQPVCGESPSRVGLVRSARKLSAVDDWTVQLVAPSRTHGLGLRLFATSHGRSVFRVRARKCSPCGGAKFPMDVIDEFGKCVTSSASRTRCTSRNVARSLTRCCTSCLPCARSSRTSPCL